MSRRYVCHRDFISSFYRSKRSSASQGRIVCRQASLLNKLARKPKCVSTLSSYVSWVPQCLIAQVHKYLDALNVRVHWIPKRPSAPSKCPSAQMLREWLECSSVLGIQIGFMYMKNDKNSREDFKILISKRNQSFY